jgi:hypothetical protein
MENRVGSDGVLYPNRYKDNDKKPDITGEITLTKDALKALVTLVKEGKESGLKIALWNRQSKSGNPYQYLKYEVVEPRPKKEFNGGSSSGYKANPPPPAAEDPDDPLPF